MSKMKRALCILLAVMVFSGMLLTGCGKEETGGTVVDTSQPQKSSDGQSTQEEQTQAEPEKTELEPVTLSWYFFSGVGQQKDQAEVEAKMTEYLKDKINASVKFYPLDWDTFITKTSAMAASGEPFDIVFTASWLSFQTNARKNWFVDLNEGGLLDKYAPKAKERLGEVFLKGGQVDGKQYALPVYKERAQSSGLMFNKAIVDKYNLDINAVNTNEDLEKLLAFVKEHEKDITPLGVAPGNTIMDGNTWTQYESLSGDSAVPGEIYADKPDTKVFNRYETPEYMEKVRFLRKWYLAGYIDKDAAAKTSTYDQKKKNGKYFAITAGTKPGADAEMSNDKVTWIQKPMTKIYSTDGNLSGAMNAISSTSKNKERALMLLELTYTDKELNNMINFGIENKHYVKISDNFIKLIPDSGYYFGAEWMFGDQTLNYLKEGEDPDKWKKFEEFNNQAVPFKSIGFSYDNSQWKNEYAAIKSIIQELGDPLDVGAIDPEKYVPQLIEKLRKAGTEKYIPDIQAKFDEWLASKQ